MSKNSINKNILSLEIESRLTALLMERKWLVENKNKPQIYAEIKRKEQQFAYSYSRMSKEEKDSVIREKCSSCAKVVENTEPISTFFTTCNCMWQRYVVQIYKNKTLFDLSKPFSLDESSVFTTLRLSEIDKAITKLKSKNSGILHERPFPDFSIQNTDSANISLPRIGRGLRLATLQEPDANEIINPCIFKNL